MGWTTIIWNEEPGENVDKVQQHGLTTDDVDAAMIEPFSHATSRSSGLPMLWGFGLDGRIVVVVYWEVDDDTVYPVTAWLEEEGD